MKNTLFVSLISLFCLTGLRGQNSNLEISISKEWRSGPRFNAGEPFRFENTQALFTDGFQSRLQFNWCIMEFGRKKAWRWFVSPNAAYSYYSYTEDEMTQGARLKINLSYMAPGLNTRLWWRTSKLFGMFGEIGYQRYFLVSSKSYEKDMGNDTYKPASDPGINENINDLNNFQSLLGLTYGKKHQVLIKSGINISNQHFIDILEDSNNAYSVAPFVAIGYILVFD